MKNEWSVNWGIHRGTLISRDIAMATFVDEKAARNKYEEVIKQWRRGNDPFGYMLWYAEIRSPNNEVIERHNGYPYS